MRPVGGSTSPRPTTRRSSSNVKTIERSPPTGGASSRTGRTRPRPDAGDDPGGGVGALAGPHANRGRSTGRAQGPARPVRRRLARDVPGEPPGQRRPQRRPRPGRVDLTRRRGSRRSSVDGSAGTCGARPVRRRLRVLSGPNGRPTSGSNRVDGEGADGRLPGSRGVVAGFEARREGCDKTGKGAVAVDARRVEDDGLRRGVDRAWVA